MDTACAHIRKAGGSVGELALDREAPVFRVGRFDVGVNCAQSDVGQELCAGPGTELRKIVGADGNCNSTVVRRGERDNAVVRRILNHVEGDVVEVALVADAIAAANTCLAIADRVVCKSDLGSKLLACSGSRAFHREHCYGSGSGHCGSCPMDCCQIRRRSWRHSRAAASAAVRRVPTADPG